MTQNQFAGGYQIKEKEPKFSESQDKDKENPLKNINQGGGLYKPFNVDELNIDTSRKEEISEVSKNDSVENQEDINENNIIIENTTSNNIQKETDNQNPDTTNTLEGNTDKTISQNQESNPENPEKNQIKLEDNKYFPLIERLYESEQISKESYESITKSITENDLELNLDNLNLESDEKKLLDGYIKELDIKNEDKNILKFGKDIKEIDEFKDFNTELDKNGRFDSEVLNLVGKNYLQIQVGEKEIDSKQDISTAIETTKNHILKEVKNIPKDSQTYLTAIENISSGNLKKQLEGINSLYVISYSSEGKLAKKEINSYTKKRKEELKARAVEITIEMNKPENQKNTEKMYKLNLEKAEIIAEANEIEGGDIFEAGDIDKVSEKLSTGKEDKS